MELLLEARADVAIANKFGYAPHQASTNKDIQRLLRVNEALIELAVQGDAGRLSSHLQSSEAVQVDYQNKDGWSALFAAAYHGKLASVQLLLDRSANTELKSLTGSTALFAAAFRGHWEVLRLLVGAHADVDIVNSNGDSAAYAAAYHGHRLALQQLVEARADVNVSNKVSEQ